MPSIWPTGLEAPVLGALVQGVGRHPVETAATVMMTVALAVVGRRRKVGWCIGLSAQTLLLSAGIATGNVGYLPAAGAIAVYVWHFWQRRGESWRAIPTARELLDSECSTCCIHPAQNGQRTIEPRFSPEHPGQPVHVGPAAPPAR